MEIKPIADASERRRLRAVQDLACGQVSVTEDGEREEPKRRKGLVVLSLLQPG
jgi:hypothetical protein